MVGRLIREPNLRGPFGAETSVRFRLLGLLLDSTGAPVNLESLAVQPRTTTLETPRLLVGATAAEVGKTTLVGKVIRRLSATGLKVAAVKVTGTGGTIDSRSHRDSGAFITADQVDAGLITTYCDSEVFRNRILRSFLWVQDHGPDLILGELGGDLIFANNPTFLRMGPVLSNLLGMVVIAGDPLSCYGSARYLADELGLPPDSVRFFSSPFRNPAGMKARASVMGVSAVFDPNDPTEIDEVLRQFLEPKGFRV